MSRRREIEASLRSLREIRDILNAMKNMARMETHRLSRFLATQQHAVAGIEAAGSDFFAFHPELFRTEDRARDVRVLLGSERGFCGDFNETLLRALEQHKGDGENPLVVLGSKLRGRVPDSLKVAAFLESASVVEEVEGVLVRLMNTLAVLSGSRAGQSLRVTVFHHKGAAEDVKISVLHPFQQPAASAKPFAYPPRLYLPPAVFASGLLEQYLFARLHELLYSSLMAENQIRVQQLDSAVQRLEKKSTELLRRRDVLRQEEITEEIEIIMLSADFTL